MVLMSSNRFDYIDLTLLSMFSMYPSFDGSNYLEAVTAFDWLLTCSDEIRLIWSRKLTGVKVLFFLNRYLWIIAMILQIMSDNWVEPDNAVSYLPPNS